MNYEGDTIQAITLCRNCGVLLSYFGTNWPPCGSWCGHLPMPPRLTCSSPSVPNSPQQRSLSSFLPEHTPFSGSLAPPPTTIPITTLSQCVICPNSSHRSLLCHLILICYSFSKVSSLQWTQTRKSPTSAKTRTCELDLSTKKPNTPFARRAKLHPISGSPDCSTY